MSDSSREKFVDRVIEMVSAKFPLATVKRGAEPFTIALNGNTARLENLYRLTNLHPADMKHHVERWVVEMLRVAEGRPDVSWKYEDVKERVMLMVIPDLGEAAHAHTVYQPLVPGLIVTYALDSDRTISYIPTGRFSEWKMTVDELHEVALQNLQTKSEAMNANAAQDADGTISLIIFQSMDGYDASRILLPTLHARLREYLGSPFGAGIPNRDILLCFRNDDATVARLKGQIAADFKAMPHQVTDKLMLITADGIAPRE